jgi:hypothetical protein
MALPADSIRHLTRAHIGARVYQGLLFCFVLVHNVTPVLREVGYPNPRLQMWLTLGALVAAATVGTYCRWRFGRVEPRKRSLARQVVRATAFALLLMATFITVVVVAREADTRPMDLIWLLLSAGTATSLATSRGERLGWVVPLLAALGLLVTLVVPALQPYRALGHAGMAAALVVTAVQLHLFLERGFRHAHV